MKGLVGLAIAVIVFPFETFAAREVSVSMDAAQTSLVLTNPSPVTVTYNITCHRADGSGTTLALTNQSLASNAKVTHTTAIPDSEQCSGGAPAHQSTDGNGKKYYYCSGSNTYANAGNACGTGNSFCFPDITTTGNTACTCSTFWLKNEGSVQFQPDICSSYGAVSGGMQIALGGYAAGYVKKSTAVGPCSSFNWAGAYADSSTRGSICCSNPTPASLCKITITNTTNASSAFLSSPSFMGGAAF